MKKMTVTLGQDTACYWSGDVEVPDDVAGDHGKLRQFLKAWADNQISPETENCFEPEYDFVNPRIVCVTADGTPGIILDDVPLGPRYHDAGFLLGAAISNNQPAHRIHAFLEAAEETGKTRRQALEFLVSVADDAQNLLDES